MSTKSFYVRSNPAGQQAARLFAKPCPCCKLIWDLLQEELLCQSELSM